MATMFPKNLGRGNFPAASEYEVYYALQQALPDRVNVYYSVSWNQEQQDGTMMGEGDFVVLDPDFGFLVLEVKGGWRIEYEQNQWTLWENMHKCRKLKRGPYDQARTSMHTYVQKYCDKYNEPLHAIYGFAVFFPNYNVENDLCLETTETNTIMQSDMADLQAKLRSMFFGWRKSTSMLVSSETFRRLNELFMGESYKRTSTSAVLRASKRDFENIALVQEACLDMLYYYNQALLIGSAGTGKTYMAIEKCRRADAAGLKALYVCFNRLVCNYVSSKLTGTNAVCLTFHQLMRNILGQVQYDKLNSDLSLEGVFDAVAARHPTQYDAIFVDEAQDFTGEWALTIRTLLKDENRSMLYVFYDEEQNIFHRDFGEAFLIQTAPFILRRNIRNTAEIWQFMTSETGMGKTCIPNDVNGIEPVVRTPKTGVLLIEAIGRKVADLLREGIPLSSIIILSDRKRENTPLTNITSFASIPINDSNTLQGDDAQAIHYYTVQSYKGLDSDVVICMLSKKCDVSMRYVAYSRARCLLYVYELLA